MPNPISRLRVAGQLLEIFEGTYKGEVRLGGKVIVRGDNATDIAPWRTVIRQFGPVAPFDEVLLLRWDGPGNACDGYGFTFLGVNQDGTFKLADMPYCGGPSPVTTSTPTAVTIQIPPHAPNRGPGIIQGETWLYKNGGVVEQRGRQKL